MPHRWSSFWLLLSHRLQATPTQHWSVWGRGSSSCRRAPRACPGGVWNAVGSHNEEKVPSLAQLIQPSRG